MLCYVMLCYILTPPSLYYNRLLNPHTTYKHTNIQTYHQIDLHKEAVTHPNSLLDHIVRQVEVLEANGTYCTYCTMYCCSAVLLYVIRSLSVCCHPIPNLYICLSLFLSVSVYFSLSVYLSLPLSIFLYLSTYTLQAPKHSAASAPGS
jgi:hypothetical protein